MSKAKLLREFSLYEFIVLSTAKTYFLNQKICKAYGMIKRFEKETGKKWEMENEKNEKN